MGSSDFHLFGHLKMHLAGNRCTTMPTWGRPSPTEQTVDTNFFYVRIQALVPQRDKCLNVNANYMEVWCVPFATHMPYIHQRASSSLQSVCLLIFLNVFVSTAHVIHCSTNHTGKDERKQSCPQRDWWIPQNLETVSSRQFNLSLPQESN